MSYKLLLAAALSATVLPAAAFAGSQVTVNVNGLDAKATQAAILQAAQTACRNELANDSDLVKFYARPGCVSAAVADANARLASMRGLASR